MYNYFYSLQTIFIVFYYLFFGEKFQGDRLKSFVIYFAKIIRILLI